MVEPHEHADSPTPATNPDPRFPPRREHVRKLPRLTQAELICVVDDLGRKRYCMEGGRPVCGRLRKRANAQIENEACLAPPCANGACKVHGGRSPGRPMTANGRYSRAMRHWRRPYERALADKKLLDLRPDVALFDTMLERMITRAERGDSPTWRGELLAVYSELDRAVRDMDQASVARLLKDLGEMIRTGARSDTVRRDLTQQVERRARTAAKAIELRLKGEQTITQAQAVAAFSGFFRVLQQRLDSAVFAQIFPVLKASIPDFYEIESSGASDA